MAPLTAPANSIGRDLQWVINGNRLPADDRKAITEAVAVLDAIFTALDAGADDAATIGEIVIAMQRAGYPVERTTTEDNAL